jgi:hypothetical protein
LVMEVKSDQASQNGKKVEEAYQEEKCIAAWLASQEEKDNARQQSVCSKQSRRRGWQWQQQQWKWKWVGDVGSERQVLLILPINHSSGHFREW